MRHNLSHNFSICCGRCGHQGDFETFTATPIGGELPAGTFQCPACQNAWKTIRAANGDAIHVPVQLGRGVKRLRHGSESVRECLQDRHPFTGEPVGECVGGPAR